MPGNKMGEQAKEKILQAAQQEFLEKGFEAAKVDDIARRAGMTKTMLYYHFHTKENIFNEIVKRMIAEVSQEFQANMSFVDMNSPDQFRDHLQSMAIFYHKHQSVIRLILSEQFSNRGAVGDRRLTIFKDVFDLIAGLADKDPAREQEEFLIKVFFFNALPMLFYASLSDQFCTDFGIAPEKCLTVFTDTFTRAFFSATATTR